ncbi:uncharacterized protein OCT59_008105 [Rhizophagus irregularis]|uniref:uncharacterized protein n=1 Tax=Rhizophagus irregularis TaxID=588596 RepID=UPI003320BAC5|nr:hypothetical protein OCT59_008105 [Rhizophagus irregularis]
MLNDITEEEKETANNIEQEIKSLLHERIRVTLCKSHIEPMEDTNLLLESISEGTYISWRVKYGETCLRASAKDCNSQKEDDKRRSAGKEIDAIITLKDETELRPNSDIRKIKLYAMQLYLP